MATAVASRSMNGFLRRSTLFTGQIYRYDGLTSQKNSSGKSWWMLIEFDRTRKVEVSRNMKAESF
jgi:hypothetical protein